MRLALFSVIVFHEMVLSQPISDNKISQTEVKSVRSRRSWQEIPSDYYTEFDRTKFLHILDFYYEMYRVNNPTDLWNATKDMAISTIGTDEIDDETKTFLVELARLAGEPLGIRVNDDDSDHGSGDGSMPCSCEPMPYLEKMANLYNRFLNCPPC